MMLVAMVLELSYSGLLACWQHWDWRIATRPFGRLLSFERPLITVGGFPSVARWQWGARLLFARSGRRLPQFLRCLSFLLLLRFLLLGLKVDEMAKMGVWLCLVLHPSW